MEDIKKNKAIQNKTKLLLLKKIKLNKYPELYKNLKDFFWNSDKYFQQTYRGQYIVVGNKDNKRANFPLSNKRRLDRRKTRKFINLSHNSNDKKHLNESKITASDTSRIDRKRGILKNVKETGLKIGQKYISDYEIEDLFNAFKKAQKLNSKKINNFVTAKEFMDKNNSLIMQSKTTTNFNKFFSENKKSQINKVENKVLPDLSGGGGISNLSPPKNNVYSNTINNDYYKTASTFISINNIKDNKEDNNLIESPSKNYHNFCSISKINLLNNPLNIDSKSPEDKKAKTTNNFYNSRTLEERSVISRNILIRKQNQYLLNSNEKNAIHNKAQRINFARLLANQEQTILKTKKNQIKINNIYNILSEKTHKSKKKLLMTNIDSYRIKNELKDKFTALNKKLEPENNYNWTKDLRDELKLKSNSNKTDNNLNIRDPYNKTIYNASSNQNLGKKKHIKYYKNIIDETNNINNNLEGLYIKGKNLLKIEYDQIKSIKNKKIFNNYEMYLPSTDVEDILFTDKKYVNKKALKSEKKI